MMNKQNVIILHEDTLISLGLYKILNDLFNIKPFIANHLDNVSLDDYDLIFVSTNIFAIEYNSFSSIKYKTISITTYNIEHSDNNQFISTCWTEEILISSISNIVNKLSEFKTSQNELSKRELDVLKLIVKGYINKEIADTLNISINTVLTHRKNITSKLGIKSVSGLSVYAMMNGLI